MRIAKRYDPTYGRIDFDIQDYVEEMEPKNLAQRVALENTLQDRRNYMKIKTLNIEPMYEVELSKSEIVLILDGLTSVMSRYKGTGTIQGDEAYEKISAMIKRFEIVYPEDSNS